ncbi:MAG: family protein phosphatase [Acidobacteriota bacterium]|jgi:protein phosphatase|nr:family protein phosphatase [Acidobacteriota bacterium]MDT7808135.1 family protein phosphatase [Acidobacteriota bacterium]
MFVELYAKTNIGRVRSGNEDNFLVLDLSAPKAWTGTDGEAPPDEMRRFEIGPKGVVLVVSDGMGGALAGDVASRMAVETVRDMLAGDEETDGEAACEPDAPLVDCLKNATDYANFAIHRKSQEDPRCSGMGATLTAAAVTTDGVSLLQVGDSRGYVIRGGQIKLATKDQSLVQQLVDVGQISEQEAETHMFRNVILQALGAQPELQPVTGRVRFFRGDILLLCSDGLSGKLRSEDMLRIVTDSDGDLARACEGLVDEANERGGEDNITVVLARLTGEDLPSPDTDRITVELPSEGDDTIGHEEDDTTERL